MEIYTLFPGITPWQRVPCEATRTKRGLKSATGFVCAAAGHTQSNEQRLLSIGSALHCRGDAIARTDGVTGPIVDVLRRAAVQAMTERSRRVGLEELQFVGARLPTTVGQLR